MSLQVWLPLNGTLENKGLGQITSTSGTAKFDKAGKTCAKALNLNSGVSFICPSLANLKTFSVCFWAMVESSSTLKTNWSDIIGFNDVKPDGTIGTFRWETCYDYSSSWPSDGIHWHDNAVNALANTSVRHNETKDEWVHCCVVFDFDTGKIFSYSNGKLISSNAVHQGGSFNSSGSFHLGETDNIGGRIQDVRFYDHALSPKEVKEISKGLYLHYRLSGHGCENLLKKSSMLGENLDCDYIEQMNSLTTKRYTVDGFHFVTPGSEGNQHNGIAFVINDFTKMNIAPGDTIIFSCDIKGVSDENLPSLRIIFDWNGPNWYTGDYKHSGYVYFTPEEDFKRFSVKCTIPTGEPKSYRMHLAIHGNYQSDLYVKNLKLEKGNIATPWTPSPSDLLYTRLGYNSTIEPDCSGFGNDGTKVGDITCDSNTARYTTSYQFNSGKDYVKSSYTNNMETFTVSYWVKPSSQSGAYATVASNFNRGDCWFGVNTENSGCWFYNGGSYSTTSDTISNDKWHHCVFVFDKGATKWYIDGKEAKLGRNSLTNTSMSFNNFTIGNSYTGTQWVRDNYCSLSDFRIYATALSGDDVLDIYQTGASVDSNGDLWAYEYKEEE